MALALCTTAAATAQTITNPAPFSLSTGNYLFNNWPATAPAGTYPTSMRFYRLDTTSDPNASASIYTDYDTAYNLTSGTRIVGLDQGGFAFLNTSTTVKKLGASVLALNTQSRNTINVTWTGKTVATNPRTYEVAMFYRIGTAGTWMPVINPATSDTVRYVSSATSGDSTVMGPFTLPVTANNQAEVDICWKYFISDTSTQSGARAEIGLNNINVTSAGAAFPAVVVTPNTLSTFAAPVNGTSPAQSFTVSGTTLTGNVTVTAPAGFEVSTTSGSGYTTSVTLTQSGGTLAGTPVYVRFHPTAPGTVSDNVVVSTAGGASQNVSVSGFTYTSTNPAAFATSGSTYNSFNAWDSLAPAGTYPPNMVFQVTNNAAPALVNTPMIADWTCVYDLPSRPRFIGLGSDGVALLNTGSPQYDNCDSIAATTAQNIFVGAAVLALNTSNSGNIILTYTAGLVAQGDGTVPRVYHLTLQERPDTASNFTNVAANDYSSAGNAAGTSQAFTYTLPSSLAGLPYMQFRWLYYAENVAGSGGSRPELRLDDVIVTASPAGISNTVLTNGNAAYPNPVAANGTVHFVQAVTGNVYDVFGRRIAALSNSKTWEVKGIAAGIYTVVTGNGAKLRVQVQ